MPLDYGDEGVVVVRTSQSFDDLATALEDQGYERDGDLLVTDERPMQVRVTAVAAAGDDLIVLAQSADLARAVAAGEATALPYRCP